MPLSASSTRSAWTPSFRSRCPCRAVDSFRSRPMIRRCIDQCGTPRREIFLDLDRHRCRLPAGQIVTPDVARLLENDRVLADRWKLDVEILERRELFRFFVRKVDGEKIHPAIAVGEKIDVVVWPPHRANIL